MIDFGGGFIVVNTKKVTWRKSSVDVPSRAKGLNPVWLLDARGIRAAVWLRCYVCRSTLGISPTSEMEQTDWNIEPPEVKLMVSCPTCGDTWLMTETTGYHLVLLPLPQPDRISPIVPLLTPPHP